jgi:oligopeptide/dipeptide ABC transporter ATP-binding protein
MEPIIRVQNLTKRFYGHGFTVNAVNGVNLDVFPGEAVGLVGESGCGKTTTARCILGLEKPTSGEIFYKGKNLRTLKSGEMRHLRQKLQIVFQDPNESLNPRFSIKSTLREPLFLHGIDADYSVLVQTMERVTLEEEHLKRYPHQLSGGQKQRVGVARAIITHPDFVVLDEPTSSLDMSLRIHILVLLKRLQRETNMAYLFISHDLSTVRNLCERIMVMYLGRVVEYGKVEDVFNHPGHVYTQALLSAIPIPDPNVKRQRILLKGETPNISQIKPGCVLQDRCPLVENKCLEEVPYVDLGNNHQVACIHARAL